MTTLTDKIVNQALTLPNDMRAVVVDKLLESLNIPLQKDIDLLWANEAEKRYTESKGKKVKSVDGEMVFNEIKRYIKDKMKRECDSHTCSNASE